MYLGAPKINKYNFLWDNEICNYINMSKIINDILRHPVCIENLIKRDFEFRKKYVRCS